MQKKTAEKYLCHKCFCFTGLQKNICVTSASASLAFHTDNYCIHVNCTAYAIH